VCGAGVSRELRRRLYAFDMGPRHGPSTEEAEFARRFVPRERLKVEKSAAEIANICPNT